MAAGLVSFGGKQGYANSTIEGLCAEANVATRSFYEHFESREDLLIAVYDRIIDEVAEQTAAAIAGDPVSAADHMRAGVEGFVLPLTEDERKGRVVELEVVGVSPRLEAHRRGVIRRFAGLAEAEIERLMELGLIPRQELGLTTLAMAGATTELLVDWLSTPKRRRMPAGTLVAEITRIYLGALGAR
jgi:AcrR family transcriptional regulator